MSTLYIKFFLTFFIFMDNILIIKGFIKWFFINIF